MVYIRSYQQTRDPGELATAVRLLRTLTYLQLDCGDRAGTVVLWQQVDGTLHRSAVPPEAPDPSDSEESCWLARAAWALGEAYPVLVVEDPAFVAFLTDRIRLSLTALERGSLSRYGQWETAHGVIVPAWLIADGADATGAALLGLAAFVDATGDAAARSALTRYSEGVAATMSGSTGVWPFGAILPYMASQTMWHAWGGLAPAGLLAGHATATPSALAAVVRDCGNVTLQALTSSGPYNSWTPRPGEAQIAYGAHSRLENLTRAAPLRRHPASRRSPVSRAAGSSARTRVESWLTNRTRESQSTGSSRTGQ